MGEIEESDLTPESNFEPFRSALYSLQRLLEYYQNRGVVIGGIAVSMLARPRFTEDIDALVLISLDELPDFLNLG